MKKIKTLGLLGTGVIGGGWAARALHSGLNVIAYDINPKMEIWIREAIDIAQPSLDSLTEGVKLPERGEFSFTLDLIEMAKHVDFIQENVPENEKIKKRL